MPPDLRPMLTDAEQALLRETEQTQLDALDEDDLVAVHDRIRRARNKYSKLYRRRASGQVASDRSRGRASASHAKAARKAELFEDALARVSRRLAKVAKAAADELKAERLAAARANPAPSAGSGASSSGGRAPSTGRSAKSTTRTPASERSRASTKASNKRSQAARDSRSR
jgi:hypothetical protein